MSRKRAKGYRAERELVELLWRLGFAVMRAPASGAKIKKADYPDVVAILKGKVAVFEVKSRAKLENIYIGKEQTQKLLNFARRAGGIPYIAVRLPHIGWKFIKLDVNTEVNNTLKIDKETIEKAPNIAGVLADLNITKTLDTYLKQQLNTY
ncbi:MAG: hypothetical protein B7O98_03215 [Zestosphaera tikiterensis]|uniref:Crossover junction endodeoxyribonuclease Hjc n=1 Tax=Zestosphaera tikiterensis TaxID=1973259 RepID=A0A2R7Y7D2_9CREN|nr:MAG: hypothetical protein B7O98_03215 [Zestosphaera tikiterensis]